MLANKTHQNQIRGINRKILGIDPGTREMGVAVLSDGTLEYYAVKTITDRTSPSSILLQGREIIYRLIIAHRPTVLAIERPFTGYGNLTATLVALAKELDKLGRDLGLEVCEISPATVKKSITGSGSATKKDVALALCERFRDLTVHIGQTQRRKENYWANMFDAVAVAVVVNDRA